MTADISSVVQMPERVGGEDIIASLNGHPIRNIERRELIKRSGDICTGGDQDRVVFARGRRFSQCTLKARQRLVPARAGAHCSTIARVNVDRVFLISFTVGVFLAALGGALTAPMISVSPSIGVNVIILAFAVVIIGGLGSIEGAAIGALFVGIARAASVHLLPEAELFVIYLVMAIVLVFRPEGLFQKTQARKI